MAISQTAPKADRIGVAVAAMVFTDLTLSIADAIIKITISDMPLSQFIFLRSCVTLPLLILILKWRLPRVSLRPASPAWAILRSSLLLSSLLIYYASLPRLDFSVAAAVYYTIPLFITLFAAFWIGERVRVQGWVGVALGFAGVLLMLKPQAEDFNINALMPLVSAILYALAMVLTRTKSRGENPLVLALIFNLIAIVLGGGASLATVMTGNEGGQSLLTGGWISMGWTQWALIGFLSMTMLIGSVGTAVAYQLGPSSIISTWDFSYLVFAVLWGVLLFSERLDVVSMLGIVLIATAGIIVIRR
uniref:DMT family transporter n=1 Tax=Mesorhizobium sp. WSM4875 TaxID=3038539 RepID=UPI002416684B|nr:DMT family transporter [Mesorhizobium sp. WSM4875]WIE94728.1 DMT family transporter [Mesorhizobium sp. WSM4875]